MWSVLSPLLAPAMVVAISPFSIIVAIFLLLHTDRARANGWAFLAGRLLALAAVTVAFLQTPPLISSLNRPVSPRILIGTAGVSVAGASGAVVYYAAVASSTVAVPVLAYTSVGARADDQLTRFKEWLHRHSGLVTAVILSAAGIALLVMGISELYTEGA